jgi:hypothetical protein
MLIDRGRIAGGAKHPHREHHFQDAFQNDRSAGNGAYAYFEDDCGQ